MKNIKMKNEYESYVSKQQGISFMQSEKWSKVKTDWLSEQILLKDECGYVQSASTAKQRNIMPNYLMQWSMISWAIDSGCHIYDFMGVPHFDDESHPNFGVYRFKKGFNGTAVTYAGEFDLILSEQKYRLARNILRMKGYRKI